MSERALPEIIAEIGVNYYDMARQSGETPLGAAQRMALEAKKAGATVAKFQTYKAEKLAAEDSPAYWDTSEEPTRSQRALFSKFDKLSFDDYRSLAAYCESVGVEFMSTPFDPDSARAIDPLVRRHKIASADMTNVRLLSLVGSFAKPVLLSTGASTLDEVREAVRLLESKGCPEVSLLHCVLCYPTRPENAMLWKIEGLRKAFPGRPVGYSDHTKFDPDILQAAWLLGAGVIEKHFTLDKSLQGNDHYHAAEPGDIRMLLARLNRLAAAVGAERGSFYHPEEETARVYARRGVYLLRDVRAGEPLRPGDVEPLRPQMGGLTPAEADRRAAQGACYAAGLKRGARLEAQHLISAERAAIVEG